MQPRVLNAADYPRGGWPPETRYVGRGTPWGNPYAKFSRMGNVSLFRQYAKVKARLDPTWLEPLRGKNLICHCAPLLCHAEVLLEMANV